MNFDKLIDFCKELTSDSPIDTTLFLFVTILLSYNALTFTDETTFGVKFATITLLITILIYLIVKMVVINVNKNKQRHQLSQVEGELIQVNENYIVKKGKRYITVYVERNGFKDERHFRKGDYKIVELLSGNPRIIYETVKVDTGLRIKDEVVAIIVVPKESMTPQEV